MCVFQLSFIILVSVAHDTNSLNIYEIDAITRIYALPNEHTTAEVDECNMIILLQELLGN